MKFKAHSQVLRRGYKRGLKLKLQQPHDEGTVMNMTPDSRLPWAPDPTLTPWAFFSSRLWGDCRTLPAVRGVLAPGPGRVSPEFTWDGAAWTLRLLTSILSAGIRASSRGNPTGFWLSVAGKRPDVVTQAALWYGCEPTYHWKVEERLLRKEERPYERGVRGDA